MTQEERQQLLSEWLEIIDRDRGWLAEKLCVSKRTVDSWFSYRKISEPMWLNIENLMAEVGASPLADLLEVTLNLEEFEALEQARIRAGFESRAGFYRAAILAYIEKHLATGHRPVQYLPGPSAAALSVNEDQPKP